MKLSQLFNIKKPSEPPLPEKKPTERMTLGKLGENAALEYLSGKNYHLLERNWRHSRSEIDLIMKDGRCVVFCEVRTQNLESRNHLTPAQSVNSKKIDNLIAGAKHYMAFYHETASRDFKTLPPCRFDVIEVFVRGGKVVKLNHISDAFIINRNKKKGTGYKSCR